MKAWLAVLGIVMACGGGKDTPAGRGARTPGRARVPTVATAAVLVPETKASPPIVIILNGKGELFANSIASWDALATKDPMVGAYSTTLEPAYALLAKGRANNQKPPAIFKMFAQPVERMTLEEMPQRGVQEGPPPLEELEPDHGSEEEPDDGSEESNTAGMMISLDEGKLGKKESDRTEGVYKMKNQDPQLEAQQARERAHNSLRESLLDAAGPRLVPRARVSPEVRSLRTITGEVMQGELERPFCLLLAAPAAKATDVIDTIAVLHPRIAVAYENKVRQLRIETIPERESFNAFGGPYEASNWIELRVGTEDLAFEAVPETPILLTGALDQTSFATALEQARKSRNLPALSRVDVLVEPDVDAQRLIDIVVALDQAGVGMIGFGRMPAIESEAAKQRGVRRRGFLLGQPNSQGDLEKKLIRKTIKRAVPAIRRCYDQAAKATPGLSGTVQTQFFITPNGIVATASGSGVSPDLAECVAAVIRTLEFPKPKGGGGVQVNYPFTFRE